MTYEQELLARAAEALDNPISISGADREEMIVSLRRHAGRDASAAGAYGLTFKTPEGMFTVQWDDGQYVKDWVGATAMLFDRGLSIAEAMQIMLKSAATVREIHDQEEQDASGEVP